MLSTRLSGDLAPLQRIQTMFSNTRRKGVILCKILVYRTESIYLSIYLSPTYGAFPCGVVVTTLDC